jgi:hypothetical protein
MQVVVAAVAVTAAMLCRRQQHPAVEVVEAAAVVAAILEGEAIRKVVAPVGKMLPMAPCLVRLKDLVEL